MEYAYRKHEAIIELDPGQIGEWRLPPMTSGVISIKSRYAIAPGGVGTSERRLDVPSGGGRNSENGRLNVGVRLADGGGLQVQPVGTGTIALDQSKGPRRPMRGLGNFDLDGLDLDGGGGFGPTMELDLELLRGGQMISTGNNSIFHETPNSGDIWALRVKRKADGSLERRRYRITVQYPSVLPLEKRRIPIGFFTRGFDQNWNQDPLLSWITMRGNVLSYQWEPMFAAMYGKPVDNVHVPLNVDPLKLPDIRSIAIRLGAGIEPDPMPELLIPGQPRRDLFYVSVFIDLDYLGSNEVEIDLPIAPDPNFSLPNPLWLEAKFFLTPSVGGTVSYIPRVKSPLFDMLDRNVSYPSASEGIKTINIKHEVVKAIESHLYRMQFEDSGSIDGFLRPYLVGRYEINDITGDLNTNELLISYVGKQQPRIQVGPAINALLDANPELDTVSPTAAWPRLLDTPFELPNAAGVFSPARLAAPIDPGALSKIDHVVVLMQENRSFDQVLGYLSRDGMLRREQLGQLLDGLLIPSEQRESRQDHINGLLLGNNDRDLIRYPDEPGGHEYRSQRTQTTSWPSFALHGPSHGHDAVTRQISDGMKGFIADYARTTTEPDKLQLVMNYFTDAELPAYGALTREFAISDSWFCSHIGGTLPNRFISLAGDFSEDVYGSPEEENPELSHGFAPMDRTTFFDHLTSRNVSWKLFEHNYGMLRLVRNYTFDETNIVGFKDETNGFVRTALDGKLPAVSFIEPNYIEKPNGNDDHAPADMKSGQRLIATIVSALLASPQWDKTLLIVTYDEHGGFYDHEPLPYEVAGRPNPPLATGERRFGVRVPAFFISPFIESMPDGKVNVAQGVFDHTTITATILRRFCGPRPPEMSPRVTGAADLRGILTREAARPRSDFDQLAQEMQKIAGWPEFAVDGTIPPPYLRRPDPSQLEEDFAGLIAFSSSVTGSGRT